MNTFVIRRVLPEEYKLLASFGRDTFYETWKHYNTESDMQLYLDEAFDEKKIKKDIENTSVNTFLFAFKGDLLTGYVKLRNDRTYPELEGLKSLELERIYVSRDYLGKDVAQKLMEECFSIAKKDKYELMWLGVNIDNHRAIAFYNKYDFVTFGSKMFKLGDAEDQDFLMKKKLS